jgi:hypothetical protein
MNRRDHQVSAIAPRRFDVTSPPSAGSGTDAG